MLFVVFFDMYEVRTLNLDKVCNYKEGNYIVSFSNVTISDEQLTKERIEDLIDILIRLRYFRNRSSQI
jgi:NADPH-dependent 7-cyano-7-deazaguanine reductase QueF